MGEREIVLSGRTTVPADAGTVQGRYYHESVVREKDAEIARLKEGMAKDCKTCKLGLEEDLIELQAKHENVAQHRRDLMVEVERLRGGAPGPNESCSDCGHAMLWVNSTWICPEHVHNRMRQAEASVKQLEGEVRAAAQINTVQMDAAREAELQLSKAKARNAQVERERDEWKRAAEEGGFYL